MIVNKVLRWILFVVYVIWNIPLWVVFSILGTLHIWKGSFSSFHKMMKNDNYYS